MPGAPTLTKSASTPALRRRQGTIVLAVRVVPADGEDDILPREGVQPGRVVLVADEVLGIGGVDVGVGVAAGLALDVVETAQADDPVDPVRMAKSERDRV